MQMNLSTVEEISDVTWAFRWTICGKYDKINFQGKKNKIILASYVFGYYVVEINKHI
jgi:hypothetical protein